MLRRGDGPIVATAGKEGIVATHDVVFALTRTTRADAANRHAGLSRCTIDLHPPGDAVRPISTARGGRHLDRMFVPDDGVLDANDKGWKQVASKPSFERSGSKRLLSTYPILAAALPSLAACSVTQLGAPIARLAALRQLARGATTESQAGREAASAKLVKLLSAQFEDDVVEDVALTTDQDEAARLPSGPAQHSALMQHAGFTLRGRSTQVLEGVVARGLGLR
jgi:hypothetical protein